jgi:DNA mismatch endonuclease (patch repair protein)
MADMFSKKIRSRIMSRIRGKDTKPELTLRKILFAGGLRYRLNYKVAGYRVDLAFPSKKLAIFVDGCFWHGCPRDFRPPKSNTKYWGPKIRTNRKRDKKIDNAIRKEGWQPLHFWEHSLRENPSAVFEKIAKRLPSSV